MSDVTTTRLLYRRGIELVPAAEDGWRLSSDENLPPSLLRSCGAEPILVEEAYVSGASTSLLLPGGRRFGSVQTEQRIPLRPDGRVFLAWQEVHYLLGAVGYHCEQLAEAYAAIRKEFAKRRLVEGDDLDVCGYQGAADHVWYELDALLGAARRALDMSRDILWLVYGGSRGRPRNFINTVNSGVLPDSLRLRLSETWERYGDKLTDYRDCIHHYTSLTNDFSVVHMDKRTHGVWLISAMIPDNPKTKSKQQFSYRGELDALDYAYAITVELMEVMSIVSEHVKTRLDAGADASNRAPT